MPWVSEPPSIEVQEQVELFNQFRGGYLSAFAQMEFTTGRLLARINQTPPFEGSLDGIKFRFESRVDAFEEVLTSKVEFQEFHNEASVLCTGLRKGYDLRNFLAHGIARYEVSSRVFTVRRILPSTADPWQEVSIEIPLDSIPLETSKMSLFCLRFMHFARKLNDEFNLEF